MRQRVVLEPQQAHAPGLLSGQDGLDDGGFQQRQSEPCVDRGFNGMKVDSLTSLPSRRSQTIGVPVDGRAEGDDLWWFSLGGLANGLWGTLERRAG
jgi:hypothetical protein